MAKFDDLYRGHRFVLSCGGEVFSASRVFTDLFDASTVWIGAAHKTGTKTLDGFMTSKTASVWMFSLQEKLFRRIDLEWTKLEWLPFDLSAADAGIAMDWVKLHGVTYKTGPLDVPVSDLPPYIQEVFSPHRHGASQ